MAPATSVEPAAGLFVFFVEIAVDGDQNLRIISAPCQAPFLAKVL
jgi:hypothetical protein